MLPASQENVRKIPIEPVTIWRTSARFWRGFEPVWPLWYSGLPLDDLRLR
jgi:hypothetical protein